MANHLMRGGFKALQEFRSLVEDIFILKKKKVFERKNSIKSNK